MLTPRSRLVSSDFGSPTDLDQQIDSGSPTMS